MIGSNTQFPRRSANEHVFMTHHEYRSHMREILDSAATGALLGASGAALAHQFGQVPVDAFESASSAMARGALMGGGTALSRVVLIKILGLDARPNPSTILDPTALVVDRSGAVLAALKHSLVGITAWHGAQRALLVGDAQSPCLGAYPALIIATQTGATIVISRTLRAYLAPQGHTSQQVLATAIALIMGIFVSWGQSADEQLLLLALVMVFGLAAKEWGDIDTKHLVGAVAICQLLIAVGQLLTEHDA